MSTAPAQLHVFQDFHVRGASAPEWGQRYLQTSPGVMRSALLEWSGGGVHAFGKWMSERVVQQGGLPRGQVCLALLGNAAHELLWAQGREFGAADLLVLQGGQDFEFQRPAGVELLSATFDAETLLQRMDAAQTPGGLRHVLGGLVRPDPAALAALRRQIRARLAGGQPQGAGALMEAAIATLAQSTAATPQRASTAAAVAIVKECHRIALGALHEQPLRIEELCSRLRTSRRTLQNSFHQVAGASPVAYLRNLRLNAVRRQLMSTSADRVSVSDAAMEAGFDHLGHFAGRYKALFGESPSQTIRLASLATASARRPSVRVRPAR